MFMFLNSHQFDISSIRCVQVLKSIGISWIHKQNEDTLDIQIISNNKTVLYFVYCRYCEICKRKYHKYNSIKYILLTSGNNAKRGTQLKCLFFFYYEFTQTKIGNMTKLQMLILLHGPIRFAWFLSSFLPNDLLLFNLHGNI